MRLPMLCSRDEDPLPVCLPNSDVLPLHVNVSTFLHAENPVFSVDILDGALMEEAFHQPQLAQLLTTHRVVLFLDGVDSNEQQHSNSEDLVDVITSSSILQVGVQRLWDDSPPSLQPVLLVQARVRNCEPGRVTLGGLDAPHTGCPVESGGGFATGDS